MHNLLGEAIKPERDANWMLSNDKRERLRRAFSKKPEPAARVKVRSDRGRGTGRAQVRASVVIAACVVLTVFLFFMATPVVMKQSKRADSADMVYYEAAVTEEEVAAAPTSSEGVPMTRHEMRSEYRYRARKDEVTRGVERKPAAPSSSMSRVVASNTARPMAVPVPESSVPEPSVDFGDGDELGDGWGGGVAGGALDDDAEVAEADPFGGEAEKKGKVLRRELVAKPKVKPGERSSGVVTGGLRSGDAAITGATIDGVLNERFKSLGEVEETWEVPAQQEGIRNSRLGVAKPKPTPKPARLNGRAAGIQSELAKQSAIVADKRRKLMEVAGKVGVVWAESERGGQTIGGELELRQLAEKQLYEAENQRDQIKKQMHKIFELGKSHPDRKEKLNRLGERLSIIEGRVAKMREVRDRKQDEGTDRARAFAEFNRLRKEYETAQGVKDQMQIEYDKERVKLGDSVRPSKEKTIAPRERPKPLPEETLTRAAPFSTFSLNVSDVSFKLARVALLEKGEWPDAAKVRTEEFVNAFDYGDPSPARGEQVACVVEQAAHPFLQQRNLLRIGMKTAAMGRSQPLRLTVLLDNSGSMEREDREASVLAAMQVLAAQLGPQDVISVVGFARQPRLLADRVRGDRAGSLVDVVARTPSEGGTNIEEALKLARTLAKRQHTEGAQSRVVLITDGVANLGNTVPEELSRQIETLRQEGIAFDACGVGAEGLNDDILEALTRKGDGRYYFLNRPEDAGAGFAKQLAGALTPAAKNVKVQVVFNPQRVVRYRLLGFNKHRLNKEDFRNDAVDAAELAAEEAGNAVYQIQVNPEGAGELGEVFVRFVDASTGRMVERSWSLPYESQPQAFDLAAPSMQLAGTAAMLGEKLHGTDAGSVRFSMISDTLGKIKGHFAADQRVQDLIRMCRKVE